MPIVWIFAAAAVYFISQDKGPPRPAKPKAPTPAPTKSPPASAIDAQKLLSIGNTGLDVLNQSFSDTPGKGVLVSVGVAPPADFVSLSQGIKPPNTDME